MLRRVLASISRRRARRWCARAQNHLALGNSEKALAYCAKSLRMDEEADAGFSLMARIVMPGDDYLAVLSRFHEWLKPESYVEIGVAHGDSLALAKPETRAVGIDPFPLIQTTIGSRARLYPVPSDAFFSAHDLLQELGTPRLSMGFIDGLHLFEQALMDFVNVERYSDAETVVLIHDCLPVTRKMAARVRGTGYWCGDVWKVAMCLAKHRPDLTLSVLPTYPSGLIIVTGLNPGSSVLRDNFQAIIADYRDLPLPYDCLDASRVFTTLPNTIPNDWEHVVHAIFRTAAC